MEEEAAASEAHFMQFSANASSVNHALRAEVDELRATEAELHRALALETDVKQTSSALAETVASQEAQLRAAKEVEESMRAEVQR